MLVTATNSKVTVDWLIEHAKKLGQGRLGFYVLKGLDHCEPYRAVIERFASGDSPPVFDFPAELGGQFDVEEQVHQTALLAYMLGQFKSRIDAAAAATGDDIQWERRWIKSQAHWKKEQQKLVELLEQAAGLVEMGQCDAGPYASLAGYLSLSEGKYRNVDEVPWCGAANLRRWAEVVQLSPVEVVFPVARPMPTGRLFRPDSVGMRGGAAADSQGAMRALIIREISHYVPKAMLSNNGYSAIAGLAQFIGLTDVSRQLVRELMQQQARKAPVPRKRKAP